MPSSLEDLAARFARGLADLRADRPETIEALRPLYAPDVEFVDPIQRIYGVEAFIKMNYRLCSRFRELTFTIAGVASAGDAIFLAWQMSGKPSVGPRMSVDGVTRAIARDDRIIYHRDYWDLAELATSMVPGTHSAFQWLIKPLA